MGNNVSSVIRCEKIQLKLSTVIEGIKHGKTLFDIAQKYDIGCENLYFALQEYRMPDENRRRIEDAYKRSKHQLASAPKEKVMTKDAEKGKASAKQKSDIENVESSSITPKKQSDIKKQEEHKMEGIVTIDKTEALRNSISVCCKKIEETKQQLKENESEISKICEMLSEKNETIANLCKALEKAKSELTNCKSELVVAEEKKKTLENDLSKENDSLKAMNEELVHLEKLSIEILDGKIKVSNDEYLPSAEKISETSTKFFISGEYEALTGHQLRLLATVCIIIDEAILSKKSYCIEYDSLPSEIVSFVKAYESSVNNITD